MIALGIDCRTKKDKTVIMKDGQILGGGLL